MGFWGRRKAEADPLGPANIAAQVILAEEIARRIKPPAFPSIPDWMRSAPAAATGPAQPVVVQVPGAPPVVFPGPPRHSFRSYEYRVNLTGDRTSELLVDQAGSGTLNEFIAKVTNDPDKRLRIKIHADGSDVHDNTYADIEELAPHSDFFRAYTDPNTNENVVSFGPMPFAQWAKVWLIGNAGQVVEGMVHLTTTVA